MMKRILSKVLEELIKPTPDLSYVRGMIEVLVSQDEVVIPNLFQPGSNLTSAPANIQSPALTSAEQTIAALQARSGTVITAQ